MYGTGTSAGVGTGMLTAGLGASSFTYMDSGNDFWSVMMAITFIAVGFAALKLVPRKKY